MKKAVLLIYIILTAVLLTGCAEDPRMPDNLIGAKAPTVTTLATFEDIKATEITVQGRVDKENGAPVTERGFRWYKKSNPEDKSSQIVTTGSNESFTYRITGLDNDTEYFVEAYAKNSVNIAYGSPAPFKTVEGLAQVSTLDALDKKSTSLLIAGKITQSGEGAIEERGFYYATTSLNEPGVAKESVASTMETDSFTCIIPNLTPETTYFIQAYVKNRFGISVGMQKEVKTTDGLPVVEKLEKGTITTSYAEFSAEVTYMGDTEIELRGFCYGLSNTLEVGAANTDTVQCGAGMGVYTGRITDVEQQRPYFVRAFVQNADTIIYSPTTLTFTLLSEKPTVTTSQPFVRDGFVTLGGVVADPGVNDEGDPVSITAAGIVWSVTPGPTIETGNREDLWNGNKIDTLNIYDLPPATTYHVRAFAINSGGYISYGDNSTFTTGSVFTTVASFSGDISTPGSGAYVTAGKSGHLVGGDVDSYGNSSKQYWKFDMDSKNSTYLSWISMTDMPERRSMMAIAANQYAFHLFGGFNQYRQLMNKYIYFQYSKGWETPTVTAPKPDPMYGSFACFQIEPIIIGGVKRTASGDSIVAEVWKQKVMNLYTWHQEDDFPEAQYNGYAFAVGDSIFAGLGLISTGLNPISSNKLWSSKKANDNEQFNWSAEEDMPGGYGAVGGVAMGTSIYIIDSEGYIRIFDTKTRSWGQANSRVSATHRDIHCLFTDGKKLYIGFGSNRTTISYDPSWDR
ncbi:fibronectin type III domain-containing protein [Parabacteroides sp. OttesenSCG-928-K15]|nr:fibronectin type III domain-containing protein [Parabacteroides sp. OttesenSCG-928-K15]